MVEILFSFHSGTSDYYRHVGVSMISIMENTSDPVRFHLMHDPEFPAKSKDELEAVAAQYGRSCIFYPAPSLEPCVLAALRHGPGTMYRLAMHEVLSLDKVLYLDCDIICELDIAELWAMDISGRMAAAVPDAGIERHITRNGFEVGKYFNAGVMLMNLAWMREHAEEFKTLIRMEMCEKKPPAFLDQDILNAMAHHHGDNTLYLEEKYNYLLAARCHMADDPASFKGSLIHMTGLGKPWKMLTPATMYYWKYYRLAPWGGDAFERMLSLQMDETGYISAVLRTRPEVTRHIIWRYSLGYWACWKKRLLEYARKKAERRAKKKAKKRAQSSF